MKEQGDVSEREKTRLVHAARMKITGEVGTVNPPVVRASTVLYRDLATRKAIRARRDKGERRDPLGMVERDLGGETAAERETGERGTLDPQLVEDADDVVDP